MIGDAFLTELKRQQGIEATSDPVLIDERKQGFLTYRFELQGETWNGQSAIRIMMTEFRGNGKSGKRRKAFTWPVDDAAKELKAIADTILNALEPGAEKQDPRTWFGRTFDNLTGARYLNYIPVVAEDTRHSKRHWLRAQIMEDNQQGQLVTLYEEWEKRAPIWMRIPVETLRTLRDRVDSI